VKRTKNWITLGFQEDFVVHSQTSNACLATNSTYKCFDANNVYQPLQKADPGSNQVSGAGISPGTLRILFGYDRVLGRRFTVGLRFGSVITGKAPVVQGDRAFMYFHGEGRVAAWLSRAPFASAGFHPYVFVSGGVAEADGKVAVDVAGSNVCLKCQLDAWKRSGSGFVGAGAGIQAAITPKSGPILETRYMQFISPNVPVLGAQLGYAVGF
jgi:hypothetical protein